MEATRSLLNGSWQLPSYGCLRASLHWLVAMLLAQFVLAASAAADNRVNHWAFQPVQRPTPPAVADSTWPKNDIDRFVLAGLERRGLRPSDQADPVTLLRRLTLDLIGLPPDRADVEAFVKRTTEEEYQDRIERLLANPHFGEQWARHWLDLARYADSAGYESDRFREIWKYRDWVIDAINQDKPFDQFLTEQLAGDLMPNSTIEQKIATGFSCNAVEEKSLPKEATIDRVNAFGTSILGLTLGCARCHDHKFDPISQLEYFELFAYFDQAESTSLDLSPRETTVVRDALLRQIEALEQELRSYEQGPPADPAKWEAQLSSADVMNLSIDVRVAISMPVAARSDEQVQLLRSAHAAAQLRFQEDLQTRLDEWASSLSEDSRKETLQYLDAYLAKPRQERMRHRPAKLLAKFWEQDAGRKQRLVAIATLKSQVPKTSTTEVLRQRLSQAETRLLEFGDPRKPGEVVQPGIPEILGRKDAGEQRDRLDLARWVTSSQNPLTARVAVNHIWQHFFGVGLVETSDNFGTQTPRPEHADLLNWLAAEFMDHGWSRKHINRLIVSSATYRQSSRRRPDLDEIDPQNRLLARQNRFRLSAENIRDAALYASGLLNVQIGGPSVFPYQPEGVMNDRADKQKWVMSAGADRYRRGMYTHFWRLTPHPYMTLFDVPDASEACPRRPRSNTPTQSLTLLNDPTFVAAAVNLATQAVAKGPSESDIERVAWMAERCLSRRPTADEVHILKQLLDEERWEYASHVARARQVASTPDDDKAVQIACYRSVARTLLNLDEFITRE